MAYLTKHKLLTSPLSFNINGQTSRSHIRQTFLLPLTVLLSLFIIICLSADDASGSMPDRWAVTDELCSSEWERPAVWTVSIHPHHRLIRFITFAHRSQLNGMMASTSFDICQAASDQSVLEFQTFDTGKNGQVKRSEWLWQGPNSDG